LDWQKTEVIPGQNNWFRILFEDFWACTLNDESSRKESKNKKFNEELIMRTFHQTLQYRA
jgi:hypothetical protein